jgi:hypothetical protein
VHELAFAVAVLKGGALKSPPARNESITHVVEVANSTGKTTVNDAMAKPVKFWKSTVQSNSLFPDALPVIVTVWVKDVSETNPQLPLPPKPFLGSTVSAFATRPDTLHIKAKPAAKMKIRENLIICPPVSDLGSSRLCSKDPAPLDLS